ncbi:hypothetical protein QJS10_CPA09g00875 [Acorus calamus]|uniref:Uncharacterized protein n=1 Tax=Acorus calamus TaxID=4465 RepID=A0AAV9EBD1_ACOCL|nr:hypothetical protein QJS10_CPA09g00875 [Acorus calamus]
MVAARILQNTAFGRNYDSDKERMQKRHLVHTQAGVNPLGDYVIPKGCFIVQFLSAVPLDETLYNGAVNFNPWRQMNPDIKNNNKEERCLMGDHGITTHTTPLHRASANDHQKTALAHNGVPCPL